MATRRLASEGTTRFLLRLPAAVRAAVEHEATSAGLSINEYCVRRLQTSGPSAALHDDAQAVMARAVDVLADGFVGLVLHGSFARGEAREASDVDVLVVVESSVPLSRSLYGSWDQAPVSWDGRPVDCHFVQLPADPARAGSVWCEAAIEGVILRDSAGRVDAALRQVRRAIADGRLVRKQVHGHPYWTQVA